MGNIINFNLVLQAPELAVQELTSEMCKGDCYLELMKAEP